VSHRAQNDPGGTRAIRGSDLSGAGAYQGAVAGTGPIHREDLHRVGERTVNSEKLGDGNATTEVVVALLLAPAVWIVVGV